MIPEVASKLLHVPRRELLRALAAGHPIDPRELDDKEFRGISVGMPRWVEKLTWKTFRKTFHRDKGTGELRGWNVRMEQTGIDGPPIPRKRGGKVWTWGHYRVGLAKGVRFAAPYDQALMIDYNVPTNDWVTRRMRDPLVALEAGSTDALLGVSYLDLGFFRLMTPTFFLLVSEGPLSYIPPV